MRYFLIFALATGLAACASNEPMAPEPLPSPPEPVMMAPPPPPPVPMPMPMPMMQGFAGPGAPMSPEERERYQALEPNPVKRVAEEPVSTFSVDVDTGSYANVRRFLSQGRMPPAELGPGSRRCSIISATIIRFRPTAAGPSR